MVRYKDIKLNDLYLRFFRGKPTKFKVVGLGHKTDGTNQKVYFESNNSLFVQSKKEFEVTKWQ